MTMETTTKLDDMIAITGRLIDLMDKEIEMLRSMRPQEIGALQKDKVSLALAYERHMQELREDPSMLTTAKPRLKAEFKRITGRFQEVLNENESALRAVKSVSEKLLNTIASAVAPLPLVRRVKIRKEAAGIERENVANSHVELMSPNAARTP